MITYRKIGPDTWGIQSDDRLEPGSTVTVSLRSGATKQVDVGAFSCEQFGKLVYLIAAPAARATTQLGGDMAKIIGLFEKAKKHLKFPAIVLAWKSLDDRMHVVRINVAGEKARVPGSLNVLSNDKNNDGERDWFGRILVDGNFESSPRASQNVLANVIPALQRFAADPAGEAQRSARLTGRCCFCNLTLTDERSTAVGYGSTCADHFGLPWGARPVAFAEAV